MPLPTPKSPTEQDPTEQGQTGPSQTRADLSARGPTATLPHLSRIRAATGGILAAVLLSACVGAGQTSAGGRASESFLATSGAPMQWDHRPEAAEWTEEAFEAVAGRDRELAGLVPEDIEHWCPGYETASLDERRAFWVGLMSAVAKHESRWTPEIEGGGGRYIGLMQISPTTARGHGCEATSKSALKDGAGNLSCAVDIFAGKVARDGMVAGGGNRGVGRDWGPFRKADKRAEMAAWTSAQPYCAKG
ncbi:transglycosylase SLT domain-containing protein [Pseudogemmobacter sonorensis]|uniref:transglycosylase SLT domain-containing protein n=1 Tax=Pseudogemmobacter sonorensis TaxID=2989681 RepID=UPI0036B7669C